MPLSLERCSLDSAFGSEHGRKRLPWKSHTVPLIGSAANPLPFVQKPNYGLPVWPGKFAACNPLGGA